MADIDLQATNASYEFGDGAVFERVTPANAGTGQYDPFLTAQDQGVENGYNTNELGQLDNVYSAGGEGGRTQAILLSSIPIKIIDGVAYYEFRLDMNEPNSDPLVSVERLEIYSSATQGGSADFQGTAAADAFLLDDGFTKVFDLDTGGDNRLLISDVTSSGSGRDDYRLLIPADNFGNADPTTTYVTMYVELGMTDSDLDVAATFEEWRTEITATVNGVKFVDVDRDGIFDADEVGLGGVTVFIDEDRDGVFDATERSTTTAADGTFRFLGVTSDHLDGDVWIDEVVPEGYEQTTGTHEVADVVAGGASYVEIGNAPLAGSISGTKYEDTDNDDSGDTGLAGWTINLYEDEDGDGEIDAEDDLIDSTTTDANGDYSFDDLMPGDYIVEEEMQAGWQSVSAEVVGAEVTSGDDTDVDFVNEEFGSISGTKYEDTDNDDDGDVGVEGWTINLYEDEDGDGEIDAEDDLIDSTTTDANGDYSFDDLAPGDYIVEEETQAGWQAVSATVAGGTLTSGGSLDFDFVNEKLGSISGTKYEDTDNDDDGDVGVEGWTINLYEDEDGDGEIDAEDDFLDSTTTDSNGDYSFDDLAPGDYIVEEETQAGWQAVSATVAGGTLTSGGSLDFDFVNEQVGGISGTKYEDTDNDGDGDVGLEGWTINLYEDEDGDGEIDAEDDFIDSDVTDANGDYSFEGLAPGDYIVEEEMQTGWQAVSATVFGGTLTSGGSLDFDFVNEELGSISGTKYEDTDNDDEGDVGVEGWTINLYEDEDGDGVIDAEDDLLDSTTTDVNGDYSFDDLAPGDYIVEEETQTGWQSVSAEVVGDTLTSGGDLDIDFVNEQLGSISGTKWADLDQDGVRDAGDDGLQGWTIALYLDDGDGFLDPGDTLVDTEQTDANGDYEFTDLAPGDYIVVENVQNGWVQTAPNAADADPESGDVNGSSVGRSEFGYLIELSGGDANGDNDFGNFLLPGSGVRTPGFWGSPNGLKFWDGIVGNETKSGPDFPSGELAPGGFLILGDDGDGVAEAGELKISVGDAQKIINCSNKDGASGNFMLARDVIATWLNFLAGNPIGDESDDSSPAYFLNEGVDWMIKYLNGDQSGANTLTLAEVRSHTIKTTSAAWKTGVSDDGIEAGADIHSALDQYNNDGSISGLAFAQDGDNGFSLFEQQYQILLLQQQTGSFF